MHFPIIFLSVITMVAAVPVPSSTASPTVNDLINGLNANLDAGNGETTAVQNLQSAESNNASASQIKVLIAALQSALSTAVADRVQNQKLATDLGAGSDLIAGLAKVQTAQKNAQAAIDTLNGSSSDTATLATLATTFKNGFATNTNNIALAQALQ